MKFTARGNERGNERKKLIYICAMLVLSAVIIGSLIVIFSGKSSDSSEREMYRLLAVRAHSNSSSRIDFDMLKKENRDVCGWLISDGTGIDYPIVHSKNSGYYKNHTFSGKKSSLGCLYADKNCRGDFSDKNTVIYGGELLDSLFGYEQQDYYELLPSATVYTPEEQMIIQLFAGIKTDNADSIVKTVFSDASDFEEYTEWIREQSTFLSLTEVSEEDRIVTICAEGKKESFVLFGRIISC